jgi:hypothetical protein
MRELDQTWESYTLLETAYKSDSELDMRRECQNPKLTWQ